jgi:2,5-diketo-D-gluconate reductase B
MTLKEDVCVQLVEASLKLGYRHLDTTQMYGNEREVGSGMRGSALKREDIFRTTKVWFTRLASGDFERPVDESLERLALPWVDLLMIHWPNAKSSAFGINCFAVQDEASGTNQAYRRRQF